MNEQLFKIAQRNLQHFWGYESFREGQIEAIQAVMKGEDTVVLFPTGGGKSLCYQIPATVFEGMTLVISPLIALMQDQVQQLNAQNVSATFINSMLSKYEVEQRLVNARNGMYKLFYCSPERLDSTLWQAELSNLNIDMVAVDEAHCISEWGHDFRPGYRKIQPALESLPESTRWIALTATATPEVRSDIIENLRFDRAKIISTGFQRPNLKWWVVSNAQKRKKLVQSVHKASKKGSGLIYGGTRRNCEELADLINRKLGVKTAAYHAGIKKADRASIQEAWITDKLPLVVATSAFGMGIDKADCRYVFHDQMPYSLEAYYQQAGRVGRDGKESYPVLFYKPADAIEAARRIKDSYPDKNQLQNVYDAVCDSLNLAVGSKQEQMKEISVDEIKKRSKLAFIIVRSSLKVLKYLNFIELEDRFVSQIGVQFIVSSDYLRERIKNEDNKEKADFLDLLYRQLGKDAFEDVKYLKLIMLQRKLNTTKNGILKGLQVLQNHDHLLEFEILGERPRVRPVEERQRSLRLSKKKLEENRDRLLHKLDYMKGYIETEHCRELYIRQYFGEDTKERCGHCDNCLRKAEKAEVSFSTKELKQIRNVLGDDHNTMKQMQDKLQWNGKKLKKMVTYLMREEKIIVKKDKFYWMK